MGNSVKNNDMQNKIQNNNKIILKMSYEQNIIEYKCYLNELLEKYLIEFAKVIQVDFSFLYVIYSGKVLYGDLLKKPISEIIDSQNKNDRSIILLVEKSKFDIIKEDEIIIILSIESSKELKYQAKKMKKLKI